MLASSPPKSVKSRRAPRKPKCVPLSGTPMKAAKLRRLRVPMLKAGEGIQGLLPEEEAFIQEEIAQRVERQWSQLEVATKAGIDRSEVQHLEHRRRGPSYRVAVLISRAFGMEVDVFAHLAKRWRLGLHLLFLSLELPVEV